MATAVEEICERSLARERKKIHESSEHIYPRCEKGNGWNIPRIQNIGSFGTTSYSIDFAKKEGKPALPRPCSVTRRNRPHPSEKFLNWRIPSKPTPGQITNDAIKAFLNVSDIETGQRFYDDYVGRPYVDKCKLSLDVQGSLVPHYPSRPRVHQRANIEGKASKDKEAASFPTLLYRLQIEPAAFLEADVMTLIGSFRSDDGDGNENCTVGPLCISTDAGQKYTSLLAKRSPQEKMMLEKRLEAGDRGYLERSWMNAIRPEAIPAIHQWLKNRNETDCNVVVGFLNNLSKNTHLNNDQESEKKNCRNLLPCLDSSSVEVSKAGRDAISDQIRQMLSRDVRTTEKGKTTKCPPLKKVKKFSRFPPRNLGTSNCDSLFMQPRRCQPRHFEIHPEFRSILTK